MNVLKVHQDMNMVLHKTLTEVSLTKYFKCFVPKDILLISLKIARIRFTPLLTNKLDTYTLVFQLFPSNFNFVIVLEFCQLSKIAHIPIPAS